VLAAPDGALLLSPLVAPGATVAAATGPYALLRTLEDAFGLLHLGHAGDADVAALGSDVFPTPTP
jgi:phosphatidylinositol-3-phosphatase